MRQLYRQFVEWAKTYDLILAIIGSFIVFGTFLSKEIYLEDYKTKITELQQLHERYENRKLLLTLSKRVETHRI